jgi:hypothetical protein
LRHRGPGPDGYRHGKPATKTHADGKTSHSITPPMPEPSTRPAGEKRQSIDPGAATQRPVRVRK